MIRERGWMLTACAMLTAGACGRSTERQRADFERMRHQQRYHAFGSSALFANQSSMQAPPTGTVPRDNAADTGVIGTGMRDGRLAANVPVPVTPERLVTGQRTFTIYCAVCHGEAAFGGSTVAQNMGPPRPPSLRNAEMLAKPAAYFFVVATHGKGRMPAYAPQLTTDERWGVVAYIERLQHTPPTGAAIDDSLRALAIARIDSAVAKRAGAR
jgi:mono/diheme cytochrome c family protein